MEDEKRKIEKKKLMKNIGTFTVMPSSDTLILILEYMPSALLNLIRILLTLEPRRKERCLSIKYAH